MEHTLVYEIKKLLLNLCSEVVSDIRCWSSLNTDWAINFIYFKTTYQMTPLLHGEVLLSQAAKRWPILASNKQDAWQTKA